MIKLARTQRDSISSVKPYFKCNNKNTKRKKVRAGRYDNSRTDRKFISKTRDERWYKLPGKTVLFRQITVNEAITL